MSLLIVIIMESKLEKIKARHIKYYQRYAEMGYSCEFFTLGNCYLNSTDFKKNKNILFSYYKQCKISQVDYYYYQNEIGVKKKEYQAFIYYKKFDKMHRVIYNIGKITYYMNIIENFIYGLIYLVLFKHNSRGMNNVRDCYFRGIGVESDRKKAFKQKLNFGYIDIVQ